MFLAFYTLEMLPQYCTRYGIYDINADLFLVPKQEQVFHVRCRLTAMKIAEWTLTIPVITWTKIFLLDSSLLLILDQFIHFILFLIHFLD